MRNPEQVRAGNETQVAGQGGERLGTSSFTEWLKGRSQARNHELLGYDTPPSWMNESEPVEASAAESEGAGSGGDDAVESEKFTDEGTADFFAVPEPIWDDEAEAETSGQRGRARGKRGEDLTSDEGIPRDEDFRIDTPDKEEAWAGILERRKEIPKDEDFRVDTPNKKEVWDRLAESLEAIDKFKEEKAREVSEKLKRHERAKKGFKRFIKKGLAMAAAAFVTVASSRIAGAGGGDVCE